MGHGKGLAPRTTTAAHQCVYRQRRFRGESRDLDPMAQTRPHGSRRRYERCMPSTAVRSEGRTDVTECSTDLAAGSLDVVVSQSEEAGICLRATFLNCIRDGE